MSTTEGTDTGRRRKDDPLGVGVDTPTLVALALGAVGTVATANLVMGDPIGRYLRGMQEQQQQQQNYMLQQQEYQRALALQQQQQAMAQNGHQHYFDGQQQQVYQNPYGNQYAQPGTAPPQFVQEEKVGENSINMSMAQPSPAQEYLGDPEVAEYVQRQIAGGQNFPIQGTYTPGVREKAGV